MTSAEVEWRELLTEEQDGILREGGTKLPASGTLWKDCTEGAFNCRGCDLLVNDSDHRVDVNTAWVSFLHSQPNAVLMDIGFAVRQTMDPDDKRTLIETHRRRCGSHLGHIVYIEDQLVHCINANSLMRTIRRLELHQLSFLARLTPFEIWNGS